MWHGEHVEVQRDWFGEVVWAGSYDAADFDRTDVVFGSGARLRDERVTFVCSASTVDRLHALEVPDGVWVSNSLACLLASARAGVDPLYPRYFEDFRTIRDGLRRYRPSLITTRGAVHLTYHHNLEWDGHELRQVRKPAMVRELATFAQYRGFLTHSLAALAANMADRSRRQPYTYLGTISSGYDSATAAALGREAGLSEAITVNRARGGAPDSGLELGLRLGLTTHVVERDAWRHDPLPEVPFLAADAKGEDVYVRGAGERLRGRVLLTGFHGDVVWSRNPRPLSGEIVRKDQSGLSLSEYRLWIGFIHCPVPFLGIRQLADIAAVSRSAELARWDWPRGNSRPICRRILEEAGLPRELFGREKRAASVLFFEEGFLTPGSLADYTTWLAARSGDPEGPARRPRELMLQACSRLVARLATLPPLRWAPGVDRLVALGRRDPRFRYVFPWALAHAARRYARGVEVVQQPVAAASER